MQGKLTVVAGEGAGQTFALDEGRTYILGRGSGTEIRILDGRLSREHCRFENDGVRFLVVDLKSTNGTRVNGAEIRLRELVSGDVVEIGGTSLKFEAVGSPSAFLFCDGCDGSIAPTDVAEGRARRAAGRLLCAVCLPKEAPPAAGPGGPARATGDEGLAALPGEAKTERIPLPPESDDEKVTVEFDFEAEALSAQRQKAGKKAAAAQPGAAAGPSKAAVQAPLPSGPPVSAAPAPPAPPVRVRPPGDRKWFFTAFGRRVGPLTAEELADLRLKKTAGTLSEADVAGL